MTKKDLPLLIAIMSIFLVNMGNSAVTAAIQNIADAFPHIKYSSVLLIATLPSLTMIPFVLLSGAVAGSKIRYKTLVIVGLMLFTLAGIAPVFLHSFASILAARALFGAGLGILSPLAPALIFNLFHGQARANALGISSVFTNIGGIIFQLVGATLCMLNWRYTFIVYLIGILSIVIVRFALSEPEKIEKADNKKVKIPLQAYIVFILFGFFALLGTPVLMNMSTIIITSNLGNAASAGFVLSMSTVGGMAAGALFGRIYKVTSKFTISVALLIAAAGLVLVNYAHSIFVLTTGTAILGVGFGIMMPAVMMTLGLMVPPAASAFALGIMMVFMNVFSFLSTFYLGFLAEVIKNPSPRLPVFVAMVVYAIAGVVYTLIRLKTVPSAPKVADPAVIRSS